MAAAPSQTSSSHVYGDAAREDAYADAYEDQFACEAALKAEIISHPLFEQLVAAHVACLRVCAPRDEQQLADLALIANRHNVAAKYVSLPSHLQSVCHDEELNRFMVDYILLLQYFELKILECLPKEIVEAFNGCQEIEEELFNLTGASSKVSTMSKENRFHCNGKFNDDLELSCVALDGTFQIDLQKSFQAQVKQELKQELKKDYCMKLKEVYDEIWRKRRAGKLPENTTHFLKDWWISHNNWPYPTEEDKAQLMAETGLDMKQINNWFINQRKRNWQNDLHQQQENTRPQSGGSTPFTDDAPQLL